MWLAGVLPQSLADRGTQPGWLLCKVGEFGLQLEIALMIAKTKDGVQKGLEVHFSDEFIPPQVLQGFELLQNLPIFARGGHRIAFETAPRQHQQLEAHHNQGLTQV